MSEVKVPFNPERKPLHELLPLEQPLRVEIDPADICNFRCDFCFQSRIKDGYKGGIMSVELFELVVEQLKEFPAPIKKVYLYALGEPLLNRNVPYFIQRLKETNTAESVAITTNGSLLTHELTDELINAGLDQISVSVNGLCDDDFARICHTKVDFGKFLHEIEYLYQNKKNCYVHVKIEGDYFTEQEKQRFFELFDGKCDTMHIDRVADIWPDMPIDSNVNLYELDTKNECPICPQPFYELCVHSDGSVTPCCAIWQHHDYNLGNVKNIALQKIWNGDKHKNLCYEWLVGKTKWLSICNRCHFSQFGASVDLSPYKNKLIKERAL